MPFASCRVNQNGYATRCARQLMLILNLFNLFTSFMSPFSFKIRVPEPMAAVALFEKSWKDSFRFGDGKQKMRFGRFLRCMKHTFNFAPCRCFHFLLRLHELPCLGPTIEWSVDNRCANETNDRNDVTNYSRERKKPVEQKWVYK